MSVQASSRAWPTTVTTSSLAISLRQEVTSSDMSVVTVRTIFRLRFLKPWKALLVLSMSMMRATSPVFFVPSSVNVAGSNSRVMSSTWIIRSQSWSFSTTLTLSRVPSGFLFPV